MARQGGEEVSRESDEVAVSAVDRVGSLKVDGAREASLRLVVEHLDFEGLPKHLITEVGQQLKSALATNGNRGVASGGECARGGSVRHGKIQESSLVRLVRRSSRSRTETSTRNEGSGDVTVARAIASPAGSAAIRASDDGGIGRGGGAFSPRRAAPRMLAAAWRQPLVGWKAMLRALALAIPVILMSLLYLPCVTYSEWYIDELFAAVRNPDARGETPLMKLLSHDFWGNSLWDKGWTHKSYRPLVVLSYAMQYRLSDIKPQPLRAFNVALHATNSALLHVLIRRSGTPWHWAALAAALFAAHPVHAENVIYLVGRADALATFCWLLAMLTWPSGGGAGRRRLSLSSIMRVGLAVVLAVIGGLCKEIGFVVLVQLAVVELLGVSPLRGSAPLLGVFGLVFLGRSWFTHGTAAAFSWIDTPVQYHEDVVVRCFTYLYFHAKYAQLMVFPWVLSWDYSLDALPLLRATWRDARVLGVLATYLGVVAVASWGFAVKSRRVLVGLSNVLVPFVPASNLFFLVGVTVGERLLYPCNVGGAMLLAAVATGRTRACSGADGGKRGGRGSRRFFLLGMALLCFFAGRCGLRVHQWSCKEALFAPDAANFPRSTKARHQIGTVLHQQGRFDEALHHFSASLELNPSSALTDYCVAQILIETGRTQEALVRLEKILSGHKLGFGNFNIFSLYVDYGFTLMMLRRFEESLQPLLQGLSLNEDVPHGLNALGYSYMNLGRLQEAAAAFERGVSYEETNPYLINNLGVANMLMGQLEIGSELIMRAAAAEPSVPAFAQNVQILRFISQNGQWPTTHNLICELFFNRG
eukprot:TRINITY_DN19301_c1_g2_i1.p1 TRINITY_DN19301_c1_g2~~TRINITY_DN19301_c1_g2_i1.p1  ORF type:complete len:815 (+),score=121.14 TRINITY_DN19301_c1_g2_i1:71-2515(+)